MGDTTDGLTGSEMAHLLNTCGMSDPNPDMTKRKRLYNAFVASQNARRDRNAILAFIRKTMKPERFVGNAERFERMRASLNRALAFAGLAVDATGKLIAVEAASTISDAQRRADDLRADLVRRGVHPDVLQFCRSELVTDNYFHAVLEATKSVASKLRTLSGLTEDGSVLVDRTLCGDKPLVAINALATESEWSEQRGFGNLVRGCFGMFRNPTAHEARVLWKMDKADAEDLLSLVSLIHRRLDSAVRP